jgi:2-polyprenyl-3-methyl-5-hydroxy-6-metoxy-1,4-benzoquinol methylase
MSYIIEKVEPIRESLAFLSGEEVKPASSGQIKTLLLKTLAFLGLYPHVFLTFMPLKILEYREMLKGVKISRSDRILDLGCGNGLQTLTLGKQCARIIGIDVDEQSLAQAQRKALNLGRRVNAKFYYTRLEEAGFQGEFFDKIFSFCVIEHIPNYAEVLAEAFRALKCGGQMIFSVDSLESISDADTLKRHRREHSVEKYFRADELRDLLRDVGFRQIEVYPIYTSSYARELFLRGLKNNFRFGCLETLLTYPRLLWQEKHHPGGKGIFFVAKCRK